MNKHVEQPHRTTSDVLPNEEVVLTPSAIDGSLSRRDVSMLEVVFQNQSDVLFFAKDLESRWISCNPAFLHFLNMPSFDLIEGLSDTDFFPPSIANAIRLDDLNVIETGNPLRKRVELITIAHGERVWGQTSKYRVRTECGRPLGLVGTTSFLGEDEQLPTSLSYFQKTVAYIQDNIDRPLRVKELADQLNLSESQFRRKFAAQFGKTPQEFILSLKLQAAIRLLSTSDRSISQVCYACGFSDQSYFTRQFKRSFGETPRAYRARLRPA